MPRLVSLLAALLVLSACDSGGPDPARLAESSITVDVPPFVAFDAANEFGATFTNTSDRTVYIEPSLQVAIVREAADGPAVTFDECCIITGFGPREARAVMPGEAVDLTIRVNLDPGSWERRLPLDGRYRVSMPIALSPDENQITLSNIDAADRTVSAPFELFFRWGDGRPFGG